MAKIILMIFFISFFIGCNGFLPQPQKKNDFYDYSEFKGWERLPLIYPYEAFNRGFYWEIDRKKSEKTFGLNLFKVQKNKIIGTYTRTDDENPSVPVTIYYVIEPEKEIESEYRNRSEFSKKLDSLNIDDSNLLSPIDVYSNFKKDNHLPWDTDE